MIPPIADSDPDPTTQIPWPGTRGRQQPDSPDDDTNGSPPVAAADGKRSPGRRQLTTWDLFTLTVSMAGSQIAWTVELGYGTPFLLQLGLPAQLTSLVWLAGPLSGLIAQPVIGALSDASTSRYRRRFWIFVSTIALVLSNLTLAYCEALANFLVDLLAVGPGDWSEERQTKAKTIAIAFAIVAFYILDFALNGLQASLRNLLLDTAPAGQLNAGNAWHGRMINAGSIIGFGFGFLPLTSLPFIGSLGSQFSIFCLICIVILVTTVWMTCYFHEEEPRPRAPRQGAGGLRVIFENIQTALLNLPKPIRRVCCVQLFAFMGWFPFLFYSTTYMGQIMALERNQEPDPELATRTGEFAMTIYSVVAVVAGVILPRFAPRDRRLMAHKADVDEDAEVSRIRAMVRQWRVEAAQKGRPLHLPVMPFLLRNIWTGALLFFSFLMFSTFFISTVLQATIFISCVGICWAVAMWVPFTIIMELLKEPIPAVAAQETRRPGHTRNLSSPTRFRRVPDERQPLIRRRSFDEYVHVEEDSPGTPSAGGTILGIHNLAIVIPQFIVALVTSAIFRIVDGANETEFVEGGNTYYGKNGVAWVLRFGGVCTLLAALIARRVPPTPTEKAMRRRLGEMKLLGEESA